MSDNDTTTPIEDSAEEAPKPSRFKNAMKKIAPFTPLITTAVVSAVGGALILKAITEVQDEEEDSAEPEVIVVETTDA